MLLLPSSRESSLPDETALRWTRPDPDQSDASYETAKELGPDETPDVAGR